MTRFMKAVGMFSLATVCVTLGACTANSDCCKEQEQGTQVNASVMSDKPQKSGCCSTAKETQVNASVMSEKSGCCASKSATECKDAAPKN